ncbi:hypothetical protein BC826DRAFT_1047584 [Russula brevipes]|nr:hypothetical protein BC826DRAFT_1047584 [Russula brevipes]
MRVAFLSASRPLDFLQLAKSCPCQPDHCIRLSPSEEAPLTPYGRDVLYSLGSPVGYSDHLLAEMSIFIVAYFSLLKHFVVYCTCEFL